MKLRYLHGSGFIQHCVEKCKNCTTPCIVPHTSKSSKKGNHRRCTLFVEVSENKCVPNICNIYARVNCSTFISSKYFGTTVNSSWSHCNFTAPPLIVVCGSTLLNNLSYSKAQSLSTLPVTTRSSI